MYINEVVPNAMKRGLIFTLYKGSRKYDDDRRNHRGISLLPMINKLFERVMLNRLKRWITAKGIPFPSINQNAYQEHLCSLLASLELQECINYNLERQSKVVVCLLDSSSAFDTVWHNGLFFKLHKLGVKGKMWRLLYNSYQFMVSNVVQDGKLSEDIKIEQSVRQGSILGPWLYMLYIHDLAVSLLQCESVARVGQVQCGAVVQADDIALAALTVDGLQTMVSCCETYSKLWRFSYNPVKTKMLVLGESVRRKQSANRRHAVTLYGEAIEEVVDHVHVGVSLNVYQSTAGRSVEAAAKMRRCLMSIVGSRVNLMELSCSTAVKLYHTIVLPRGLYGAELWYKLTKDDLSKLDVAHRFCLKTIQSFPKRAKSVIVERMAKCHDIEAYIDKKKLLFVGRLCRLQWSMLAKKVFIERLHQDRANGVQCGVLTDGKESQCIYCNKMYRDQLNHFLQSCEKYEPTREYYWSLVLNTCSVELSAFLYNLPDDEFAAILLGKRPDIASDDEIFHLFCIGARSWQLLAHDKTLKFYT